MDEAYKLFKTHEKPKQQPLSQTASKTEEFIENAKSSLGRISLGVNLSPDPISTFGLKLALSDDKADQRIFRKQ
jgi:hypothetical protein